MKKAPAKMKKKSMAKMKKASPAKGVKVKPREGSDPSKPDYDLYRKKGLGPRVKKAPTKFNKGLKAASAAGKLDNNPKFKKAVDASPAQMKKSAMKMKKESMAMMKKSVAMMKKASAMKMKMKKK